jgi:glycosyltransferase involved in cell wall biosynthesis
MIKPLTFKLLTVDLIILTDVAIVRNNFITYDTGLVRIIRSLSKRYSTIIFGWNREGRKSYNIEELKKEIVGKTSPNNSLALKILKLKAPVREVSFMDNLPLVIFLPLFWIWVFFNLVITKPKIVQACDLDTVLPCYIYKKIFRKKMIFYIFDRYAMTFIPTRFKMLFYTVQNAEEFFSKKADVLVTVGKRVLDTFKKKPEHCAIIANSPEDYNHDNREKPGRGDTLKVVYGGHIMPGRGLENIASAVSELVKVEFCIYGLVIDKKLLDELVSIPNVKYKGFLATCDEYYESIMTADVMIAVYTLNVPSNSITTHNKTYEAMMCGIPIITNLSTEFVREIGYGITVDYDSIDEIRSALITLRDNPELCKSLGKNGRRAFLEKYNWKETEKELYRIYDNLLVSPNIIP